MKPWPCPLPLPVAAPEGDVSEDVIEFDELCLRQSPPLWLWVGVSRLTRQVLGLALGLVLGERTDQTLARAWAQVPPDYRSRPVYTDHWGAYARLLPAGQHRPCDKGNGLTSIVPASWRAYQVASAPVGAGAPLLGGPPKDGGGSVRALRAVGGRAQPPERAALPEPPEAGRDSNTVKPIARTTNSRRCS